MDRVVLAQNLAAKTGILQEQLAKGSQLLQTMNATAALDRNPRVALYGGVPNEPATAPGFGVPTMTGDDGATHKTMDGYFQDAINYVADANGPDPKGVIERVRANTNPEQFKAFLEFALTKARQAEQYGVPLAPGEKIRSVEEFRKLLQGGE
jgi:hypothetical protein